MRIKVILTNHQVENQSNFLLTIPFSIQTFSDFNEYLKEYFSLSQSINLQFSLDGFCIMQKESIHQLLKELDTLKITLVGTQSSYLNKRKGSTLPQKVTKKIKTQLETDDKFAEFVNDMLAIQQNIENDKKEEEGSSQDTDQQQDNESDDNDDSLFRFLKQNPQKSKVPQKVENRKIGGKKNDKSQLAAKLKEFTEKLKMSEKKMLSDSSSSDDSSSESEAESKKPKALISSKQTENNDTSKKYQKVLEKEQASIKRVINKVEENKIGNPIQQTFQKGEVLKQLEQEKSQVKVLESKNSKQAIALEKPNQPISKQLHLPNPSLQNNTIFLNNATFSNSSHFQNIAHLQKNNQSNPNLQNNSKTFANQIPPKVIPNQQKINLSGNNQSNPTAINQSNILTNNQSNLSGNNQIKSLEQNNKIAPKQVIQKAEAKKVKALSSSSSSSSSSSLDEDSDNNENVKKSTIQQPKIQLSFQKLNNQPNIIQNQKPQSKTLVNETQPALSNLLTPVKNQQSESVNSSANKSAKPTLPPLKGPSRDHVLNLNIKGMSEIFYFKNPLEIYEEKKVTWKEVSGFTTKMDRKLQKEQDQKQQIVNTFNNAEQKRKSDNEKPHLVMNHKSEQKDAMILEHPHTIGMTVHKTRSTHEVNEEVPLFDLTGFDKINLKDMIDYEKSLNKSFFNENDQIYFKDLELDEEMNVPRLSEWKKGTITQIVNVKQVRVSVVVGNKVESSLYNTGIFNSLYLKSQSEPVTEKKEQVTEKKTSVQVKKEQSLEKKESSLEKKEQSSEIKESVSEKKEEIKQESESNNSSIESKGYNQNSFLRPNSFSIENDKDIMIGRQVNYYYGDKNYYKDKYILEHSNRHEANYMSLTLLLNFPKIKKSVENEEELLQILLNFIKKTVQVVNYELSPDFTMIRKKSLHQNKGNGKNQGKQNNNLSNNSNNKKNNNNNMNSNNNNKNFNNQNQQNNANNQHQIPRINSNLLKKNNNQLNENSNQMNTSQIIADKQNNEEKIEIEEGESIEVTQNEQKNPEVQKEVIQANKNESKSTLTQKIVQNVDEQLIKEINQKAQSINDI